MKKLLQEFKTFAMRGNVMDMAVGIILGAAFGKIVSSLVSDIIMPPIGLLLGGVDFSDLSIVIKEASINATTGAIDAAVAINYGQFIQIIIDFLIVAFAVFLMIKGINKLSQKKEEESAPAEEPAPSKEEILLTEIRDLLKEKK